MQTPFFVRPLTADERASLETGLRSSSAVTVRRCQGRLASAERQPTTTLARSRHGTDHTVRHALHACHQRGLTVLQPLASPPPTTSTLVDAGTCEARRALVHPSPRTFGKPTSRWTRALAAAVSVAQGLTPRRGSDEPMRVALRRWRVSWKRANHWLTSPEPAYARQQNGAPGCSSGLCPSRRGPWGAATTAGGVGWPSLTTRAGRRPQPRPRSRSGPSRQTLPLPRRSPVMACCGDPGHSRPTRGGGGW
jgi:hypothetical protein